MVHLLIRIVGDMPNFLRLSEEIEALLWDKDLRIMVKLHGNERRGDITRNVVHGKVDNINKEHWQRTWKRETI